MEKLKKVWVADQGDGTFVNPIIHADYSDPDVIRVGDDFFMTASSFNCTPGLPVLHSKDLVNWELINYAIKNVDMPGYEVPGHGKAIWAPAIRYHNNKFWICVGLPDEGIYMTVTEDPFGEWSPLFPVKKGLGLIDPCPFWDEDGQAYLVHAFAASRAGEDAKSKLILHRMAPDGSKVLDEGKIIFDGTKDHPTLEGPKMYKRNGYYYIMAPAGGVSTGWQTILRSENVWGPYEDKVVLHQGDTEINGPHQGGWVELESGESWFIHFQDKRAYGRITHLQPVTWVDDWPLMGHNQDENDLGEPVLRWNKPNVGKEYPVKVVDTSDLFAEDKLGLQWQWFANHQDDWYLLGDHGLRLHSLGIPTEPKTMWSVPNILAQKFPALEFSVTTKVTANLSKATEKAGLVITGDKYCYLAVHKNQQGWALSRYEGNKDYDEDQEITSVQLSTNEVYLRAVVRDEGLITFKYSTDGKEYHPIGNPFQSVKGRWIGAKAGLYCIDENPGRSDSFADFKYFIVEEI